MTPAERAVRRNRLAVGLVFSEMVDNMTSREIQELTVKLDRALDLDRFDAVAPPPSDWPDRCEVRADG